MLCSAGFCPSPPKNTAHLADRRRHASAVQPSRTSPEARRFRLTTTKAAQPTCASSLCITRGHSMRSSPSMRRYPPSEMKPLFYSAGFCPSPPKNTRTPRRPPQPCLSHSHRATCHREAGKFRPATTKAAQPPGASSSLRRTSGRSTRSSPSSPRPRRRRCVTPPDSALRLRRTPAHLADCRGHASAVQPSRTSPRSRQV